jgi:hypothetical protein
MCWIHVENFYVGLIMAAAYTVELVTEATPPDIIRQMFERSGEIRDDYACGGIEGSPDIEKDVRDLFPQKKHAGGRAYIQRRYITRDPIAGVVGYCDIRYPITEESEGYPDFAIYDYGKDQKVLIVYVALSCSFTLSNQKVGEMTVRDIITAKREANRGLPNVGKFIKQEIGRMLMEEFRVNRVMLLSISLDSAKAQHRKNGGRFFTDEGFSIFEPMTSSVTKLKVIETFMQNAMTSIEFLYSDNPEEVQETLREDGFYVMYPPLGGGRRRTRRRRAKKPTKRRRRS